MGAVTGNKCWGSLKYRIRDFTIKYGRQFDLDWTKVAKSLEGTLSRAVEVGDYLAVDLARQDLKQEAIKHYKG